MRFKIAALVAFAFLLLGCEDALNQPDTAKPSALRIPVTAKLRNRLSLYERTNLQIAKELPGYGGQYYDDAGNMHVYLVDTSLAERAKARFRPEVQARPTGLSKSPGTDPQVIVHQGTFDYPTLLLWSHQGAQIV